MAMAIVAFVLVLVPAASMAGVFVYERASADRILPGVRVGGIDVGGMTRSEALTAVSSRAEALLDRQVTIRVGDRTWVRSFRQLGVNGAVREAVGQAFAVSGSLSWMARAYHRLADNPLERSITLGYRYQDQPVRSLLQRVAGQLHRPARNAAVGLKDGKVVFQRARKGRALDTAAAVRAVMTALRSWRQEVRLDLEPVLPKITEEDLGKTITIDLSTNTLRLLDGFHAVRAYDVGTAMRGFSTREGPGRSSESKRTPLGTTRTLMDGGRGCR